MCGLISGARVCILDAEEPQQRGTDEGGWRFFPFQMVIVRSGTEYLKQIHCWITSDTDEEKKWC